MYRTCDTMRGLPVPIPSYAVSDSASQDSDHVTCNAVAVPCADLLAEQYLWSRKRRPSIHGYIQTFHARLCLPLITLQDLPV